MLSELNNVAFGILSVTHAISLKRPLALHWIEFAPMQARTFSGRSDTGNLEDQLNGCFGPAPWRACDLDRTGDVFWHLTITS